MYIYFFIYIIDSFYIMFFPHVLELIEASPDHNVMEALALGSNGNTVIVTLTILLTEPQKIIIQTYIHIIIPF